MSLSSPLGRAVLVPIANPASMPGLLDVAAHLTARDRGTVMPVTVLPPQSSAAQVDQARDLILRAEAEAQQLGVQALGVVAVDESVVRGILDAADERDATLILTGWHGGSTATRAFSPLIDALAGRSPIPLAVAKLGADPVKRVLLPVSDDHLRPGGTRGLSLAARLAALIARPAGLPVWLLRSGVSIAAVPDVVQDVHDEVIHDHRRIDVAVGAVAQGDDMVVLAVPPTIDGLRVATSHVPWKAPASSLLVAVDVGPVARRHRGIVAWDLVEPVDEAAPQVTATGDHR